MNDYYLLEERLKELSSRRKVLEKKSELRQATLNEFERIKLINTRNTYQELEKQNEDARLRNQKFLNHVNNTVENLAVYRSNQHSSESGECLLQVTHAFCSFSYLFFVRSRHYRTVIEHCHQREEIERCYRYV
jgi:hypothetical protein